MNLKSDDELVGIEIVSSRDLEEFAPEELEGEPGATASTEGAPADAMGHPPDTDGDGLWDFRDLDTDNDTAFRGAFAAYLDAEGIQHRRKEKA